MGLLKFGYTVDMDALQNPAIPESFLIGYDLDGVLKQKDYLGNITPIGSVTNIVGAASNFLLSSSGLDSLGNKTASIIRSGGLRIGTTQSYTEMSGSTFSIYTNVGGTPSLYFSVDSNSFVINNDNTNGDEKIYWSPSTGLELNNIDSTFYSGFSSYGIFLVQAGFYTTDISAKSINISNGSIVLSLDVDQGISFGNATSSSFISATAVSFYQNSDTLTLLPTTLSGDQIQYYQNKSGTFSLISDVIDSSLFYLAGSTNSVINSKTQSIYRTGNIGIGTASPSTKLHIYATASGAFRLEDGTQGSNYILKSDSNGLASWTPLSSIGISGSASYIPKFTGTSSLGNSNFIDNGSSGFYKSGTDTVTFILGSNIFLRLLRGQSSMDFSLGNPGAALPESGVITSYNTHGLDIKSQGYLALSAGPSYSEAMRISTNGYVGIGLTATPSTKLHIYATQSGFGFRLQDGSQGNNYILISNSIGMGSWTSSIDVTGFRLQTGAQPGYILTSDATGVASWTSSATTIYWYTENTTPPSTAPVATGTGSIAIGNNAKALSSNMFVYGESAGLDATGTDYSNLIGYYAGFQTQDSLNTNIIGNYAGFQSQDSDNSNFIGNYAGFQSPGSKNSNFIGNNAGLQSSNVSNSNFFGEAAGKTAPNVIFSNFFGHYAGQGAYNSDNSNFFGDNAGQNAHNTGNSNFLGSLAGKDASGASNSNFLGRGSGQNAGSANNSNFIGNLAGNAALSAFNSNFLGQNSGKDASFANNSNFLGFSAGENSVNSNNSNFIGQYAGQDAFLAHNSNFIGNNTGKDADYANNSNFIGERAGKDATNANNSNFLGQGAGQGADGANNSNFIGANSGLNSDSNNSNFIGQNSGELTLAAHYSNFFGFYSGNGANSANDSNFFGRSAGQNATSANNSNLFGFSAGKSFTSNNIGSNNIVIGTNISLPDGATNSINLGGVLFGLNTYSDTNGDPSIVAQPNGRIGINVVNPTTNLHVYGTQSGAFRLEDGSQGVGKVLTSDVDGVGSWTSPSNGLNWVGLISQTTGTPSVVEFVNTLGYPLTWTRAGSGTYYATIDAAAPAGFFDNVWCVTPSESVQFSNISFRYKIIIKKDTSDPLVKTLVLTTMNNSGSFADGLLNDQPIEIRIYNPV
jgi:hypothetical protein